jgi:hypothetical protein
VVDHFREGSGNLGVQVIPINEQNILTRLVSSDARRTENIQVRRKMIPRCIFSDGMAHAIISEVPRLGLAEEALSDKKS